jgi:hypothetical protein
MSQSKRKPGSHAIRMTGLLATASFLSILAVGCGGASTSKSSLEKEAGRGSATTKMAAQTSPDPGIDLNCTYDRLRNPPDSFHYVYKKVASDGFFVDQEADITPQTIDGFFRQQDGSQRPLHAVHSDAQSWQTALAGLTAISGMSSTVATFNHSSAMRRESDSGQLNGYNAIHYSIDTARWDATTRQMLGNFALGPGGLDKGEAWVTAEGCPVKLSLDEEMHKQDGSLLEKVDYEVEMVKK